jgi:hypothetical protein
MLCCLIKHRGIQLLPSDPVFPVLTAGAMLTFLVSTETSGCCFPRASLCDSFPVVMLHFSLELPAEIVTLLKLAGLIDGNA